MLTCPSTDVPFAAEGRELAQLLKRKAPDEEIQPVIERIHSSAIDQSLDPLVTSTDVFTTAVLAVGSKSLSHVLAAIERTKERFMDAGAASGPARAQIISAVMNFWSAHPGVAITIIEKLLNYGIISPAAVVQWALSGFAGETKGEALARSYIYEMVFNTVAKVTKRTREVVSAPPRPAAEPEAEQDVDMSAEAGAGAEETKQREIATMKELFKTMEDALVAWASGTKDEIMEDGSLDDVAREERDAQVKRWGERWLRTVRRKSAIEDAFVIEAAKQAQGRGAEQNSAATGPLSYADQD